MNNKPFESNILLILFCNIFYSVCFLCDLVISLESSPTRLYDVFLFNNIIYDLVILYHLIFITCIVVMDIFVCMKFLILFLTKSVQSKMFNSVKYALTDSLFVKFNIALMLIFSLLVFWSDFVWTSSHRKHGIRHWNSRHFFKHWY